MFDNNISIMNNIAIVQSQGFYCELPTVITANDLPQYYGTVELPVAQSKPTIEGEVSGLDLLFGAWVASGDEDAQLNGLYRSRVIPSRNSAHE